MLMKTPAVALPPTLDSLATVLRDRSLWPYGFEWDFRQKCSCAIGMAEEIWGPSNPFNQTAPVSELRKYAETFCNPKKRYVLGFIPWGVTMRGVTPEDVADRIEKNFP
jgi:hypothetical protein